MAKYIDSRNRTIEILFANALDITLLCRRVGVVVCASGSRPVSMGLFLLSSHAEDLNNGVHRFPV